MARIAAPGPSQRNQLMNALTLLERWEEAMGMAEPLLQAERADVRGAAWYSTAKCSKQLGQRARCRKVAAQAIEHLEPRADDGHVQQLLFLLYSWTQDDQGVLRMAPRFYAGRGQIVHLQAWLLALNNLHRYQDLLDVARCYGEHNFEGHGAARAGAPGRGSGGVAGGTARARSGWCGIQPAGSRISRWHVWRQSSVAAMFGAVGPFRRGSRAVAAGMGAASADPFGSASGFTAPPWTGMRNARGGGTLGASGHGERTCRRSRR